MDDTTAREARPRRKNRDNVADGSPSRLGVSTSPRRERRFESKPGSGAVLSTILASLAAVSVGAGTYGQWLRDAEKGPHPYAFALLAGGALVLIGLVLFGARATKPLRIGDAGLAVENAGGELERLAWCDVERITRNDAVLTFHGSGTVIAIDRREQPEAWARAVAEAIERLPAKATDLDRGAVAKDDEGEIISLEPAQVAGLHCKKTDKLIAFERDAKLCTRCGEVYHKDGVPSRCLTCEAKLR